MSDSFLAFDDTPPLAILDRSTLERWALCPWQAKALEEGRVTAWPKLPVVGELIHEALSRTAIAWADSDGGMSIAELRECVETELLGSRPDLQPDAIAGFKASTYAWASMLHGIHPDNIIALDGGEEISRSGQFSADFVDLGVRITSEVDLLFAAESVEQLEEIDYKTGWKVHTASDVAQSLQFQLHAVLVFENFPKVHSLALRVWNTRTNRLTYRVEFPREKLSQYRSRVRLAIQSRIQNFENPPTWPTFEKCSWCPVASLCPVANEPIRNVAASPAEALRQLVALDAKADALRKLLTAHVDASGQDITADGVAFGRRKKSERKPAATMYEIKGDVED